MATILRNHVQSIHEKALEMAGFDPARLARVREATLNVIDNDRCHGVSMIVASHGKLF